MTPCQPTKPCGQRDRCARPGADGPEPIDASCSITSKQAWCPMFIDKRAGTMSGPNPSAVKIGRPRGEVLQKVEALVVEAGAHGLILDEVRKALPGYTDTSLRSALYNLRDRYGFRCITKGSRFGVFTSPAVSDEAANAAFEARFANDKAAQKEKLRLAQVEYQRRRAEEARLRRLGLKEAAEKARMERRARVEAEVAARKAQAIAEKNRKAQLTAAKKAEAAAINRAAKRIKGDGTRLAEKPVEIVATVDMSQAKITKIPRTPGRYEVLESPGPFSSMRPGQYAFEASSCAARALA